MRKILFRTTLFAAVLAAVVGLPSQSHADSVATNIARPSLALLPPMGWNFWNCLTEHVTEQAVRDIANAMRFPIGIKALADYVHSKGLKFDFYTSPSESTCGASS